MSDLDKRLANLSPEKRALLAMRLQKKKAEVAKKESIPRRAAAGTYPLSFAQQRLWFLDQLESGSPLYNIAAALRLSGALNVAALQRGLAEIMRRHEVLRATFVTAKGRPVQVIAPANAPAMDGAEAQRDIDSNDNQRRGVQLNAPTMDGIDSSDDRRGRIQNASMVRVVDLRALPEDLREQTALRLATAEAQRPFDLARGPLVRASLLRLAAGEHLLLLTMHHIVSDGWSTGVLVQEFAALYDAFAHGRPPTLPDLPIQYADFAAWQRAWLQGEDETTPAGAASPLQVQLRYWTEQLRGAPAVLELPTDRPRPAIQTSHGAHYTFMLPAHQVEGLKALSQREEATLFMTLLAGFQTLLYRYTGQEDVCVGSPIAGRNRAEIEGLIGLFVNTLVLRGDLSGNPRFRELLGRVREVTLGAYAHQDLPFEMLVEELRPAPDLSRTPLFQAMLVLQNAAPPLQELPNLTMRLIDAETGTAKFDLLLLIEESAAGLKCVLEYNTDLFDEATIARMAAHFQTLLAGILVEPDQRIAALPLLDRAERDQVLVEWSGADHERLEIRDWRLASDESPISNLQSLISNDPCLHDLFEAQAARAPDAVALAFEDRRLTYQALNARANQLAHHLRALGAGPDTLVGICTERSPELMIAVLGVLKAGAAYLPLDPSYPPARLDFMLQDSQAGILITLQEPRTKNQEPTDEEVGSRFSVLGSGVCEIDLSRDWPTIAQQPTSNPNQTVQPDNLAYVIYTSGSTGTPKGVMVTHANVLRLLSATEDWFHFDRQDVWTLFHSYAFDFSVWEIWGALLYGGRLVVVPYLVSRDPSAFYDLLWQEQVTVLNQTPAAFRQLIAAETAHAQIPTLALRYVIFGGEALEFSSLRPWFARHGDERPQLVNMYGITETTVHVTYRPITRADLDSASVIGVHIPDLQIYVLDAHLQPQPIGVAGELYVGGAGVARGYLNRPALTAERFIPNPFADFRFGILDFGLADAAPSIQNPNSKIQNGERLYKTGDLARWRADGDLEYLGRIDHQIKLRGFRIELGEIAAALGQHPAVLEAAVVVREDAPGDRRLVAYLVPKIEDRGLKIEDSTLATQEKLSSILYPLSSIQGDLRTFLRDRLPEYMVPGAFVVLDAMPLTSNGKLDRKALPAPDGARPEQEQAYVAPRTDLEHYLADLWRDILSIERVGVYDNFFELGGDSIQAAILANRIQEELGAAAHVRSIFYAPTVADLSMYVNEYFPDAVAARFQTAATRDLKSRLADQIAAEDQAATVDESKIALIRQLVPPLVPRGTATRNPPAVFVLSPPRSGSTLLRVMLAGHPRLFSPPELELLTFNTLEERQAALSGPYEAALEGTIRAIMEARGDDTEQASRLMAEYERRGMNTHEFYALLQEWIGERILVDKTPSYSMQMEVLRRAETEFADARYIHLVRHPYATIYSFVEARLHEFFFRYPHPFSIRDLAELIWIVSHQNILTFLSDIAPDRHCRVVYEDLVSRPAEVMGDICRFLGLEFYPEMAQPYQGTRMTDGIRPMSQMVGDLKFYLRKDIDARAADRWKRLHASDFLSGAGWQLAETLGYARPAERVAAQNGAPASGPRPTPRDGMVPLSFAQQRLWFLDQLEPGSPFYNIPVALRLTGRLDVAALRRSIAAIVRRHEVLRTTFATVDGQPAQVITETANAPIPIIDLRTLAPAEREPAAERLCAAEARRPFDLERGPLLRVALLRLNDDEHVIALTLHHIIADGWSTGVLVREIAALYAAFAAGQPEESTGAILPALPIQYADYAAWQRGWLQGEGVRGQLEYWKRRLAGSPPLLELPTDRPRPATQSYQGARRAFVLPPSLSEPLKELGQRTGATLFMTLTAAFQTLLARYSGQEDICVGTPVAGRGQAEIAGLIGFFVNMLVLRSDLAGDPPFRTLLRQVQQVAADAFAHQDLPFELLVDQLQPERNLSHTPLFQVVISLQKAQLQKLELPGITLNPLLSDSGTAKFDLTLALGDRTDGLRASLEYNTDLFDDATIERMIGHFRTLLESVIADPEQPIMRIPLLSAGERAQLLAEQRLEIRDWRLSDTETPISNLLSLISTRFAEQAARTPDVIALVCESERLSYATLNARANQLAHHLQHLGAGPDSLVALYLDRSLDMLVAILGVLKAGAAYLPIDPSYPQERIAFMLQDAKPIALITNEIRDWRLEISDSSQSLISHLQSPTIINLDVDRPTIAQQPASNPEHTAHPDNLAYVIYTSGSTGTPKGSPVTHANVMRLFSATDEWFHFDSQDVWTMFHSVAFDFSVWEIWGALLYGGRLVIVPYLLSRDPAGFYTLLGEQQVTVLNQTPAAFRQLMAVEAQQDVAPDLALRYVVFGGEALELPSLQPWFERHGDQRPQLINMYGITETTVHVTYRPLTRSDLDAQVGSAIGVAIPDLAVYVLDQHLQPQPVGVPGELYVGGAGLARGYLGRPQLTAERFIPNPFATTTDHRPPTTQNREPRTENRGQMIGIDSPAHPLTRSPAHSGSRLYKTGDRARWRASGELEYLGRLDHQVKLRGFRIELGEIAAALARHPAVRETLVIVREDTPGQQRLVAYLTPTTDHRPPTTGPNDKVTRRQGDKVIEAGESVTRSPVYPFTASGQSVVSGVSSVVGELRTFLATSLPEYMIPSAFVVLDQLPLTGNGKVDRRALPVPEAARPEQNAGYQAPRTQEEEILAGIWGQVLGLAQVGVDENFFALGGDSILSIQVIARARAAGLHLTARQFFLHPTIAGQAALAEKDGAVVAEQGLVTGPAPLTPIQHWFFAQELPEPQHYNQAVLLEVRQALDPATLEAVVLRLVEHHDALRLRFTRDATGWRQVCVEPDGLAPITWIDLSGLPETEQPAAIEAAATRLQAGLNLAAGPLLRVASFDLGADRPGRLLLVIHHLAVDGVSWRILLEDFQTLARQLAANPHERMAAKLPPKTTSFQAWALRLAEHAQSDALRGELEHWLSIGSAPALPLDRRTGPNSEESAQRVLVSLDEEETRTLLQDVPAVYGTEINDVLLTALAQTIGRWTGARALLVDLEGHGREDLFADVDLSRTVGWCTSIYPVRLEVGADEGPGTALKVVKEQLRGIPGRGIGYGLLRYLGAEAGRLRIQPEISFNYLGQFDQLLEDASAFAPARESSGPAHSPRGARQHLLGIDGGIAAGRLRLTWTYSENLHDRSTIERLAQGFITALRELIAHCRSSEAGGYTPSDFPDVELSQEDIEALMDEISEAI